MKQENSNANTEFDPSGMYESGMSAGVRSLRLMFFSLVVIIVGMVIYFITLGGYTEIKPQQSTIVFRFGRYVKTYDRGWYWFLPYPVTSFASIPTNPQTVALSFLPSAEGMNPEGTQSLEPGRDAYLLTGDANIIHTGWSMSYRITDPEAYYRTLATPRDPHEADTLERTAGGKASRTGPQSLLKNLLARAVIRVTSMTSVADILGDKKSAYSDAVEQHFVTLLADAKCGVTLNTLTLDFAAPPQKTKAAFDEVAAAGSTQSSMQSQADEYRIRLLNSSEAERAEVLAQARTYKTRVVAQVQSEGIYFKSIQAEYVKSPRTVLTTLYSNVLGEVIARQENKFVLGTNPDGAKQVRIKLNPETPRKRDAKTAEEKKQ